MGSEGFDEDEGTEVGGRPWRFKADDGDVRRIGAKIREGIIRRTKQGWNKVRPVSLEQTGDAIFVHITAGRPRVLGKWYPRLGG